MRSSNSVRGVTRKFMIDNDFVDQAVENGDISFVFNNEYSDIDQLSESYKCLVAMAFMTRARGPHHGMWILCEKGADSSATVSFIDAQEEVDLFSDIPSWCGITQDESFVIVCDQELDDVVNFLHGIHVYGVANRDAPNMQMGNLLFLSYIKTVVDGTYYYIVSLCGNYLRAVRRAVTKVSDSLAGGPSVFYGLIRQAISDSDDAMVTALESCLT